MNSVPRLVRGSLPHYRFRGLGQTPAFQLYADASGTIYVLDANTGAYVGELPAGTNMSNISLMQDGSGAWYVQDNSTGAVITSSTTSPTSPTAAVSSAPGAAPASPLSGISSLISSYGIYIAIGIGVILLMGKGKKK